MNQRWDVKSILDSLHVLCVLILSVMLPQFDLFAVKVLEQ